MRAQGPAIPWIVRRWGIVWLVAAACRGTGADTLRSRLRAHDEGARAMVELPVEARAIMQPPWARLAFVWGDYDLRQRGVVAAAFAPDGRTLVAVGRTGGLRIWDTATRTLVHELPGGGRETPEVTAFALSPRGGQVLLGDRAGRLIVRDLGDGRIRTAIDAHDAPIRFVAFAGDGLTAVSYGHERRPALASGAPGRDLPEIVRGGELRRWQLSTGVLLAEVRPGGLDALAASPDLSQLVGCGGGRLRSWDGATLHDGWHRAWPRGCDAAAFAGDGRRVAMVGDGDRGRELSLVDASSGAELATLAGDDDSARRVAIAVSPAGADVAIAGAELYIWRAGAGPSRARSLTAHTAVPALRTDGIAYAPDGSLLLTWGGDQLALWDPVRASPIARARGHEEPVIALAVSGDGRWLASASRGGTLRIWQATSGSEIARWSADVIDGGLAFLPDGERLLVAEGNLRASVRGGVTSVVRRDGTVVWRVERRVSYAPSQLSPDGSRALTIGSDDGLTLLDAATGAAIWRRGRRAFETRDLLWLADGARFVADDERGALWIWDAATGAAIAQLAASGARVLARSPDGTRLAAAGSGLRVFDLTAAGSGIGATAAVELERDHVGPIAFPQDAGALLTAEADGRVRQRWLDGSAEPAAIDMTPAQDRTTAFAISADGKLLYCGTERGVIMAFHISALTSR